MAKRYLHQESTPWLDPGIVADLKRKIFSIRRELSEGIVHIMQEELRTGKPAKKTFEPSNYWCDEEPEGPNVGAAIKREIEKAAQCVPQEHADRAFDKWLGKTARERRISFEVLGQMTQVQQGPEMKKFPTSVLRNLIWSPTASGPMESLTVENAKELCDDWNVVREGSDAYSDSPSAEELSLVAKRLVDMLSDGLQSNEAILPTARWSERQYDSRAQTPLSEEATEDLPHEAAASASIETTEPLDDEESHTRLKFNPYSPWDRCFVDNEYKYVWEPDEFHQDPAPIGAAKLVASHKKCYYNIRTKLPQAVVHSIQNELHSDDPTEKFFKPSDYELSRDPEKPNVGAASKDIIEKEAESVAKDKADRVLDKWLGKTAREKRVSYEVLGQLSQWRDGPVMTKFPVHIPWNHDIWHQERTLQYLSKREAKELCVDWNPVCEGSDAYNDFPSREELSSVAMNFVDLLAEGLVERRDPLYPEQRWQVKEYGPYYCCED